MLMCFGKTFFMYTHGHDAVHFQQSSTRVWRTTWRKRVRA
jgi:hypothetical protein